MLLSGFFFLGGAKCTHIVPTFFVVPTGGKWNDPVNILRYLRDRDEKFELALQIHCKIKEKSQFIISLCWGIGSGAESLFLFCTVPVPVGDAFFEQPLKHSTYDTVIYCFREDSR